MHKPKFTSYSVGRGTALAPGSSHKPQLRRFNSERGSSLLEFAFVLPVFVLLITGMAAFGITFNQYLELNNAVTIGAQQLAISRAAVTDPCAQAVTAVANAAPLLVDANIAYKIIFTAPSGSTTVSSATFSGASPTCSGAATANMGITGTVELEATYPCNLAVYGADLVPGCTLNAQVTEVIQ